MENNKKFTEEDIKKIEKTLQYIFTPVKTITSVASSEFMKGKGEVPNNDFAIKIDGEETRIFAVANVEGLAKNIWWIADQFCDIWKSVKKIQFMICFGREILPVMIKSKNS